MVCLLFLLNLSSASSAQILVLNNRDALPYQQFTDGLRESSSQPVEVSHVGDDLGKIDELLQSQAPKYVVALTAQIARYLQNSQVKNSYFSMISNAHAYGLDHLSGVELNASPKDYLATVSNILPYVQRIGVMYSSSNQEVIDLARKHATDNNLIINALKIEKNSDISVGLDRLLTNSDAIWIISDPLVTRSARIVRDVILLKSIKANKPVFGLNKWAVKNGALFCLSADYRELGQQLATMIEADNSSEKFPREYPNQPKLFINSSMVSYFSAYSEVDVPSHALVLK